jgi:septal ring factor EnvC (AmiA/AmiB activator)
VTAQEVGTLVAGPASAVVVCVLVLGALYRIVDRSILPLVARSVERHLAQVDLLLEQQRKESAALAKALASFERALGNIDSRLARLEDLTDSHPITRP